MTEDTPFAASSSLSEDVAAANPGLGSDIRYSSNCLHCVTALEMRRRGRDVVATPTPVKAVLPGDVVDPEIGRALSSVLDAWRDGNGNPPAMTQVDGLPGVLEVAKDWPDGARAWVGIHSHGGHFFSAEKIDGEIVFVDPQFGTIGVDHYFVGAEETLLLRVDNLVPDNRIVHPDDPLVQDR